MVRQAHNLNIDNYHVRSPQFGGAGIENGRF
jgi:hypothetical protein